VFLSQRVMSISRDIQEKRHHRGCFTLANKSYEPCKWKVDYEGLNRTVTLAIYHRSRIIGGIHK
jgi:hypothetical protein